MVAERVTLYLRPWRRGLETLVGTGIGFQVVPGITAASGCFAAGIHPPRSRPGVRFVTAHGKGRQDLDWPLLAESANAGLPTWGSSCATIREQLLAHGRRDTPVALIDRRGAALPAGHSRHSP